MPTPPATTARPAIAATGHDDEPPSPGDGVAVEDADAEEPPSPDGEAREGEGADGVGDDGDELGADPGSGTHHSSASRSLATSSASSPGAQVIASPCTWKGSSTRVGDAWVASVTGPS